MRRNPIALASLALCWNQAESLPMFGLPQTQLVPPQEWVRQLASRVPQWRPHLRRTPPPPSPLPGKVMRVRFRLASSSQDLLPLELVA